MPDGMYLSWEEAQRLALPPNTTMLIPPTPDAVEVPALAAAAPPNPDWLDDPDAERAAAEREQYGPAPLRVLANVITVNALLQYAQAPPKKNDEEKRQLPPEPRQDKP